MMKENFEEMMYGPFVAPLIDEKLQHKSHCPFMHKLTSWFFPQWGMHEEDHSLEAHPSKKGHESPFYSDPEDIAKDLEDSGIPTAVFHGLGDGCIYGGMHQITNAFAKGTGSYAKCIEVGLPTIGEYFNNFEHVAQESCKKIAANKHFKGEFNVVGLSQGGLLARYIVEECEMPGKVRNMLTLGGPHMGVEKVPQCESGLICDAINFVIDRVVYTGIAQDLVAPAGYFRNVHDLKTYDKKSVFLPMVNNEISHKYD
jgi:hypothetical protein